MVRKIVGHNVGAQYSMEIRKYGNMDQLSILYPAKVRTIRFYRVNELY